MRSALRPVLGAAATFLALAGALTPIVSFAQARYTAEVRRTSYGIAHIKANDYGSIGYYYRIRIRYWNAAGQGPWSGYSNVAP